MALTFVGRIRGSKLCNFEIETIYRKISLKILRKTHQKCSKTSLKYLFIVLNIKVTNTKIHLGSFCAGNIRRGFRFVLTKLFLIPLLVDLNNMWLLYHKAQ